MDVYEDLGVKKLINARGTLTRIGGSLMPDEVLESMREASKYFVDMHELLEKAGRRIAKIAGTEAAFVTSGAAAGLTIATAACITGLDEVKVRKLPNTYGMKNEVVKLRSHSFYYDQAIRESGAKIVEVGGTTRTDHKEIEQALGGKTAAMAYVAGFEKVKGSLLLKEVIEIANDARIPMILDAAGELPPVFNLRKFTDAGADLVVFSGGKGIRGPQSSGLILGRKDLIEACALNSCPNHSIGRPMKVDKEAIAGLVKAVEIFVNTDFDSQMQKWERQVEYFVDNLSGLPHISLERGFSRDKWERPDCIPRVYLRFDVTNLNLTTEEVVELLKCGEHGIAVGQFSKGIYLNPHMLKEGEETTVVSRLKEILSK
jgi:L-seryl-tRNA(Ser) seleniumtransferase